VTHSPGSSRASVARPARTVAGLALLLTGALGTAACSGSGSDASDEPSSSSSSANSTSPSDDASASPSDSATPSGAATSATADPTSGSPSRSASASSRLLGAADLPVLQAGDAWTVRSTGSREPANGFGTCQRFATTSIGAERVAVRRFAAAGLRSAGELVATFPDALTARRAYAVLGSWRAKCADRLSGYHRVDVGKQQPVPLTGGQASWYLLVYGPVKGDPDTGYFDAQGAALVGSRIAMVSMLETGQNYDYEPGQEPLVGALRAAARRLS
jgi:type V secretory pathway adhesin AidA